MRTTVYLNSNVRNMIIEAAQVRKVSCSEMIVILLKKVVADMPQPIRTWRLIQYQKKRAGKDWETVHVTFREDEFEYFLDIKKIFKKSLSLIVTQAVEKFLKIVIKEKKTYKNLCVNYIFLKEIINSVPCWKFIWGYPPGLELHMLKNNLRLQM
jgi:hypothetical protein